MMLADGRHYFVFTDDRREELKDLMERDPSKDPISLLMNVFPDDCLRLEKTFRGDLEFWDMRILIFGILLGYFPEIAQECNVFISIEEEPRVLFLFKCLNALVEEHIKSLLLDENGNPLESYESIERKVGSCGRCAFFLKRTSHTGECAFQKGHILGSPHLCKIGKFKAKEEG